MTERTPVSNFRIPPELKQAAIAKAASEGRTLTDVVVEALKRYVKRGTRTKEQER